MTPQQQFVLFATGAVVVALLGGAFFLLFREVGEHEIGRRVAALRQDSAVPLRRPAQFWPASVALVRCLGNAFRNRVLSSRDARELERTLASAGFEPSKAMPIFMGAKAVCLCTIPGFAYACAVVLGYTFGTQIIASIMSLAIAMLVPNWAVALIRRPYQRALRIGIPDALDLLVVCVEAGLGLESALERVANEMKKSNQAVGMEFSVFSQELRIMPDRRVALANLSERTGQPALRRLAATISQTMRYGTPLSRGLRSLAEEMREERMIQFEERAGRLPVLLTLPMILFILPCLFIVIMGQPISQLAVVFSSMHQ